LVTSAVEIGIIGGSGITKSELIEDVTEVKVSTPYGRPSDLIMIGYYDDRKVAFLSRHGRRHQIPPHKIPYRANIWALKELGVKRIITASAVGSLQENLKPSEFILIDQFIDRTKDRGDTFYEGSQVYHVSTADPFCPDLRNLFIKSANELAIPIHKKGIYICIQGPRFSTRAESRLFRSWGVDVIGMTLFPEVALAREASMCYASIAMITDYDVWAEKPVNAEEVIKTMSQNVVNFRRLVLNTIPKIPKEQNCFCKRALESAKV
jgi:5'-methylthioadenosine phosphorylase